MEPKYVPWAKFKAKLAKKKATLQVDETSDRIKPFFVDGGTLWYCLLWKSEVAAGISATNAADLADFEANYRTLPNLDAAVDVRNPIGQLVTAKGAYAYSEEDGTFEGGGWFRPTPGAQSFFDVDVTKQLYVQGGIITVADVTPGDIAEFSVVDKADTLGLFSTYGLSTGNGDVLEIRKYVRNHGVPFRPAGECLVYEMRMSTAADVVPGLTLRMSYTSVGTVAPWVGLNYEVFEGD